MIFKAQQSSVTKASVESQFGYCLLLKDILREKTWCTYNAHIDERAQQQGNEGTQCAFLCLFEILLYFDGNYFVNFRVESLMTWENPTAFYCEIKVVIVVKKICNVFFFTPENLV